MFLQLLSPLYLYGLLLVAVPLIFHLVKRKKRIIIDFSSLYFFDNSLIKESRIFRIKRILLLILRILLLILLALIFSKPVEKDPFAILSLPETEIYCYVDPSASMNLMQNGTSVLEKSFSLLHELRKEGFYINMYNENSGYYEKLTQESSIYDFLKKEIYEPLNIGDAVVALNEIAKKKSNVIFMFISDLQQSDSSTVANAFAALESNTPAIIVDASIRRSKINNFYMSEVDGKPYRLKLYVSEKSAEDSIWSLFYSEDKFVDSKQIKALSGSVFSFPIECFGKFGFLYLDSKDDFPYDDTLFFANTNTSSNNRDKLLVSGKKDNIFLLSALFNSVTDGDRFRIIEKDRKSVASVDVEPCKILVFSDITGNGYGSISLSKLYLYVRNKIVFEIPYTAQDEFTIKSTQFTGGKKSESSKDLRIVLPKTSLWESFPTRYPEGIVLKSALTISGYPLVKLSNGKALVTYFTDEGGNVILTFAAPLNNPAENNLQSSGFLIAMMDRLMEFALSNVGKSYSFTAGVPFRNNFFHRNERGTIYRENTPIASCFGHSFLTINTPGNYKAVSENGQLTRFSVNFDKKESVFSKCYGTIKSFKSVKIVKSDKIINFIEGKRVGGYYIIVVLIFFICLIFERRLSYDK